MRVRDSNHGRGLYAIRSLAKGSVLGQVSGEVVDHDKRDPMYLMDVGNDLLLLPHAPFRYLNHSCEPNCELFGWEDEEPNPETGATDLFVGALRGIKPGSELTIDYSWPAHIAIPCGCRSKKCRGWIVCESERHLVKA